MNKKKGRTILQRIKNCMVLIFVLWLVSLFISKGIFSFLIEKYGKCTKAIAIEEESGGRYSSYTYKYQFNLGGKVYNGKLSKNENYKPGDSVCVIYLSIFPKENRSYNFYKTLPCKCSS
jgi:hypothetical protein